MNSEALEKAKKLYKEGMSITRIARILSCTRSNLVYHFLDPLERKRYNKEAYLRRKKRKDPRKDKEAPEEIETLFKVEPPLIHVDVGFGYQGVLLVSKKSGKVQCHICGGWYTSVANHSALAHQIKASEYRRVFGLSVGTPLISLEYSKKRANIASNISPERLNLLRRVRGKKRGRGEYPSSMQYLNSKGLCPLQVERRINILIEMLGRLPDAKDLLEKDPSLYTFLSKKEGGFGNYMSHHFPSYRKFNGGRRAFNQDLVIAAIRERALENGGELCFWDFFKRGNPQYYTLWKYCGSWPRAMAMAGMEKVIISGGSNPNASRGKFVRYRLIGVNNEKPI